MICGGRYQLVPVETNLGNNALRVKLLEGWFEPVLTRTAGQSADWVQGARATGSRVLHSLVATPDLGWTSYDDCG